MRSRRRPSVAAQALVLLCGAGAAWARVEVRRGGSRLVFVADDYFE